MKPDASMSLAALAAGTPEASPSSEGEADGSPESPGLSLAAGEIMSAFSERDESGLKKALLNFIRMARK